MHGSAPPTNASPSALLATSADFQEAVQSAFEPQGAGQLAVRRFVAALARQAARQAFAMPLQDEERAP